MHVYGLSIKILSQAFYNGYESMCTLFLLEQFYIMRAADRHCSLLKKKTRYGPGAVRLRWLENLTLFGPGGGVPALISTFKIFLGI